jgi:signal transduction histidine kinase
VRLLRSALAERELTVEEAIALMEYHEERNRIAKASHDKAWHARHERVKYLPL